MPDKKNINSKANNSIWEKSRIGQTVAKSDQLGTLPNEDRFRLKNPIALSDGAGGAGLFTGEWAEYLCDHLPNQPITSYNLLCE